MLQISRALPAPWIPQQRRWVGTDSKDGVRATGRWSGCQQEQAGCRELEVIPGATGHDKQLWEAGKGNRRDSYNLLAINMLSCSLFSHRDMRGVQETNFQFIPLHSKVEETHHPGVCQKTAQDIAFQIKQKYLFPRGKEKASNKQNRTTTKPTKTPETLLSADGKTELIIYWIFFCVSGLFWKQLQKHFFFSYFTQKNRVTITTLSVLRKNGTVALAAQGKQQI